MSTATMPTPTTAASQSDQLIAEALKRVTTIGTLPEVTVRIIQTVEDPRSSAGQLNEIVAHDPALVARILRVVNSSFYGLPGQIGTVERAIVLLGLNGVRNLALASSLGHLFRGLKLCEPFTARDLWKHCISVGVACRILAQQIKLPVVDEAFLGGMIHDVGILVHLQLWPEKIRTVCETARERAKAGDFSETFCQLEQRIIGVDHEHLGRALCHQWHFPQSCQRVAGYHHHPESLNRDDCLLVGLVHVADTVCCQKAIGFNLTATGQTIGELELQSLGLNHETVEQVLADLPAQTDAAFSVLS
jgi:HD-like signal output (HDOD) protein